jgi:hypothetical protein
VVRWLVLTAEDSPANDTTNATKPDKCGRAEGTLPLAADIVGLPGKYARHIGVTCRGREEDAEVPGTDVLDISKEAKSCEEESVLAPGS